MRDDAKRHDTRRFGTRRRAIAVAVVAGLALAACGSGRGPGAASSPEAMRSPEVVLEGVAFVPRELTVTPGTMVTWVNRDPVAHTVTSGRQAVQGVPGVSEDRPARPDGGFDGDLDAGRTFTHTFERPGRYAYFCRIHVGMTALVVVE